MMNPYRRTAAGVFVPTDRADLEGWWDASDESTITDVSGSVSGFVVTPLPFAKSTTSDPTLTIVQVNASSKSGGSVMVTSPVTRIVLFASPFVSV